MDQKKEIIKKLSRIYHSALDAYLDDTRVLKSVHLSDENTVKLIFFEMPGSSAIRELEPQIESQLFQLTWLKELEINLSIIQKNGTEKQRGLKHVSNIIAVSSCKGGVGKSTIALMVASALQQNGANVGVFDADIHGPSLPTLITPKQMADTQSDEYIPPFLNHNIKLMSYGYIQEQSNQPAILRGPNASNLLKQILFNTDWGHLDYLIIDCPPGTGDILLSLTQEIKLTTSIIITTPHELAYVDVEKGIEMFNRVKVPTFCIIENMSYFTPPDHNEKYYIFGNGRLIPTAKKFNIDYWFEMPIEQSLSSYKNTDIPYLMNKPNEKLQQLFHKLSNDLAWYLYNLTSAKNMTIDYNNDTHSATISSPEKSYEISLKELRFNCRCAHCIEEMTGEIKIEKNNISDTIQVKKVYPIGHYAYGIDWDDAHSSMYTIDRLITEFNH